MLRDATELEAQAEQRKQSAANAARTRWAKQRQSEPDAPGMRTACAPQCEADANPEARIQSGKLPSKARENPSDPPSAIPTLDEVKRYAASAPVPISPDCAVAFHDTQQAEGWITRNGHPIADWRAALRRYASRWNEVEKSKRTGPGMAPAQPRHRVASGYGESTDISEL